MYKYNEGQFYPPLTDTILSTMSRLLESQSITLGVRDAKIFQAGEFSWKWLYGIAKNNGLRWRWDWESVIVPSTVFSLGSAKSKVNIIKFQD